MKNPNIQFLPLTLCDLTSIMLIEQEAQNYPWSRAVMLDCITKYHSWKICAQNPTQILGYSVLQLILDEAHLLSLTIAKKWQKQSLGHKLLDFTLHQAYLLQASTCFLEVASNNQAALNLYLKYGFNEIGVRRNYYHNTKYGKSDAIIMAHYLQAQETA